MNFWKRLTSALSGRPSSGGSADEPRQGIERALCINCGSLKPSAYSRCKDCQFAPTTEAEAARSCLLTTRFQSKEKLAEYSNHMKQEGAAIVIAESDVHAMLPGMRTPLIQKILERNRQEERSGTSISTEKSSA